MCSARKALFTALSASPVPTTPQCTIFWPKHASTGRARSSTTGSPPTITVSVPFSAPATPPLTGASRKSTPAAARRAAIRREPAGSPEVQSTTTDPFVRPAISPSSPSRIDSTSADVGKQVTTTVAPVAASLGDAAARTLAPADAANAAAFAPVRFQTASSISGLTRCRAIGVPIAPRPRNAMRVMRRPRKSVRGKLYRRPAIGHRSRRMHKEAAMFRRSFVICNTAPGIPCYKPIQ